MSRLREIQSHAIWPHVTGGDRKRISPIDAAAISALLLAAMIAAGCEPAKDAALLATTQNGIVRGVAENEVLVFKNIPFAAPPVGELRWRPPQPVDAWEGVLDGTSFGTVCPQELKANYNLETLAQYRMAEDCLNLNVWTQSVAPAESRPVMVWILPGGFTQGAGQMPRYNGAGLARQGMVVVTFNYRLGYLGQFAHPELTAATDDEPLGNFGLMDQVAALEWVRDNIAAFGGDPAKVTIFGMSAGGVSVNYLMAVPAARGLFHRAISQSSAIRMFNPRRIDEDVPGAPSLEQTGLQMAEHFGIAGGDIAAQLRALSWEQVHEFQNASPVPGGSLNPVLDGRLVVDSAGATFRDGRQAPVPFITGATSWEGSLARFLDSADPVLDSLRISRAEAEQLYRNADERTMINNLGVDTFLGSQRYLAKLHAAAGHPSFLYFFSRVLESAKGELPGAAHGAETRYAMQTLDSFAGPSRMVVYGTSISPSDRTYADIVSSYWVDFARHGDPNGGERPQWPRFGEEGRDRLLEFGQDQPVVREDFLADRMKYFENHFNPGKY